MVFRQVLPMPHKPNVALQTATAAELVADDDEAVIQTYLQAGQVKRTTAINHASWLRGLARWLRADSSRPSLSEIVHRVGPAKDDPDVQAFRQAQVPGSARSKNIIGAVNALRTGTTTVRPVLTAVHDDDEAVIQAYLRAGQIKPATAKQHATELRGLARWLRAEPSRPSLSEIAQRVGPARDDPDVRAFRQTQAAGSGPARHIIGAVNALRTGTTTERPVLTAVHGDDEAVVQTYLKAGRVKRTTANTHASWLRNFARWLRADPSRPRLSEIAHRVQVG